MKRDKYKYSWGLNCLFGHEFATIAWYNQDVSRSCSGLCKSPIHASRLNQREFNPIVYLENLFTFHLVTVEGEPSRLVQYCNCLSRSTSSPIPCVVDLSSDVIALLSFQGAISRVFLTSIAGGSFSVIIPVLVPFSLSNLYDFNLSSAVLKSSKIIVSVKHLNTNASFQNGFKPSGRACLITLVTERQSRIMKQIDKAMLSIRMPNRGDCLTNSMIWKS